MLIISMAILMSLALMSVTLIILHFETVKRQEPRKHAFFGAS